MSASRLAYVRGAVAHRRGLPASACPHDDFRCACFWLLGWYENAGHVPAVVRQQARIAAALDDLERGEHAVLSAHEG